MISIIVPIYNVEKYVVGCLTSIQKQTYSDFEVICINDGSTDKSAELVQNFIKTDNRFHFFSQPNKGQACARNKGLEKATGELILFVDSDDYLHPKALEILVKIKQKTQADVVGGSFKKTSQTYAETVFPNVTEKRVKIFDNPLNAFMTKREVMTGAPIRLYPKSLLDKIRFIEGIYFEDVPFTTMVMGAIPKFALSEEPLYYYYENQASTMRSSFTLKKVASYDTVIRTVYRYIKENRPDDLPTVQRFILNARFKMMVNQAYKKQKDKALQQELFQDIQKRVSALYQEGIISFAGLKLKHRLCLWLLLKNKVSIAQKVLKIFP